MRGRPGIIETKEDVRFPESFVQSRIFKQGFFE